MKGNKIRKEDRRKEWLLMITSPSSSLCLLYKKLYSLGISMCFFLLLSFSFIDFDVFYEIFSPWACILLYRGCKIYFAYFQTVMGCIHLISPVTILMLFNYVWRLSYSISTFILIQCKGLLFFDWCICF